MCVYDLAAVSRGVRTARNGERYRNQFEHKDRVWLHGGELALLWEVEGGLHRRAGSRGTPHWRSPPTGDAGQELSLQWQQCQQLLGANKRLGEENKSVLLAVKTVLRERVWVWQHFDLRESLRVRKLEACPLYWRKHIQFDPEVWLWNNSLYIVVLLQSEQRSQRRPLQIQHNQFD